MKRIFVILSIASCLFTPTAASADSFQPSPYCHKPDLFMFNGRSDYGLLEMEVENYRFCINRFIEEQNEAVQVHRDAAQAAVRDWNSFVHSLSY